MPWRCSVKRFGVVWRRLDRFGFVYLGAGRRRNLGCCRLRFFRLGVLHDAQHLANPGHANGAAGSQHGRDAVCVHPVFGQTLGVAVVARSLDAGWMRETFLLAAVGIALLCHAIALGGQARVHRS